MHGTHTGGFLNIPPSGKSVTMTGTDIVRIVDGKVRDIWHVEDAMGHLQQIGAIPAPGQPAPK
jgi:predicted ester cyclase